MGAENSPTAMPPEDSPVESKEPAASSGKPIAPNRRPGKKRKGHKPLDIITEPQDIISQAWRIVGKFLSSVERSLDSKLAGEVEMQGKKVSTRDMSIIVKLLEAMEDMPVKPADAIKNPDISKDDLLNILREGAGAEGGTEA